MVAVGHPAAGRPSDRPGGPSIASINIISDGNFHWHSTVIFPVIWPPQLLHQYSRCGTEGEEGQNRKLAPLVYCNNVSIQGCHLICQCFVRQVSWFSLGGSISVTGHFLLTMTSFRLYLVVQRANSYNSHLFSTRLGSDKLLCRDFVSILLENFWINYINDKWRVK